MAKRIGVPPLDQVIRIATSQVGIRESPRGSNRGPEVDQYLRTVGLNPENASFPWCAAFVYWCFDQAAKKTSPPCENPLPKLAGVVALWREARKRGTQSVPRAAALKNPEMIIPGAVFCISSGNGKGHCGFVESVGSGRIKTIEGNTTAAGSREGDGVYRRTRAISSITLGFLIYG